MLQFFTKVDDNDDYDYDYDYGWHFIVFYWSKMYGLLLQPSSCLSDKEEDEIYGFAGYGVYGKQMLHRHQQQAKLVITPRPTYQK